MSLELNRRDLLRFFGIGATIVPVIGGAAKTESLARLIEIPKIEPVKAVTGDALRGFETLLQIGDGRNPETFSTISAIGIRGPQASIAHVEVTAHHTQPVHRQFIPTLIDDGQLAFSVLHDPRTEWLPPFGWNYLYYERLMRTFRLVDQVRRRRAFQGFVLAMGESYPVDGIVTRDITIRITTSPSVC